MQTDAAQVPANNLPGPISKRSIIIAMRARFPQPDGFCCASSRKKEADVFFIYPPTTTTAPPPHTQMKIYNAYETITAKY